MKRLDIKRTFIAIAAAAYALLAVSCQTDDTLAYNNMTMGNVVDGRFVSDQGNTFNVVSQICEGRLEDEERALILCDVLNRTKASNNEYDINLRSFVKVLEKDAVALEEAQEGEIAVKDPIHIDQLWFAGGYLNMLVKFHTNGNSEAKHLVNLVYSKDEKGAYVLEFRHNAFGDKMGEDNAETIKVSGGYVSFPITKLIKENDAKIVLNWKWYKSQDSGYDFKTEDDYEFKYDWKRSKFEHKF